LLNFFYRTHVKTGWEKLNSLMLPAKAPPNEQKMEDTASGIFFAA
jgi:hypothetical protein